MLSATTKQRKDLQKAGQERSEILRWTYLPSGVQWSSGPVAETHFPGIINHPAPTEIHNPSLFSIPRSACLI
jgi:hypothetical protein